MSDLNVVAELNAARAAALRSAQRRGQQRRSDFTSTSKIPERAWSHPELEHIELAPEEPGIVHWPRPGENTEEELIGLVKEKLMASAVDVHSMALTQQDMLEELITYSYHVADQAQQAFESAFSVSSSARYDIHSLHVWAQEPTDHARAASRAAAAALQALRKAKKAVLAFRETAASFSHRHSASSLLKIVDSPAVDSSEEDVATADVSDLPYELAQGITNIDEVSSDSEVDSEDEHVRIAQLAEKFIGDFRIQAKSKNSVVIGSRNRSKKNRNKSKSPRNSNGATRTNVVRVGASKHIGVSSARKVRGDSVLLLHVNNPSPAHASRYFCRPLCFVGR